MRSPDEVKLRAKTLRQLLATKGQEISQGHSLEIISKLEGYRDWNTFAAHLNISQCLLPVPKGWRVGGDQSQQYEFGCDPTANFNKIHPAVIRSKNSIQGNGFGTLMQSIKVGRFAGQRVRLHAHLKATNCIGAVTIWLRADGPVLGQNIAFDNMEDREKADGVLTGTTDWKARHIVLDIPKETVTLNFGFYLRGTGIAHASAFELDIVGTDIPVTSKMMVPLSEPMNLQFSDLVN